MNSKRRGAWRRYLTVCLDVLPPDLAPGVTAPSAHLVARIASGAAP